MLNIWIYYKYTFTVSFFNFLIWDYLNICAVMGGSISCLYYYCPFVCIAYTVVYIPFSLKKISLGDPLCLFLCLRYPSWMFVMKLLISALSAFLTPFFFFIIFCSITTCVYIVRQLLQLSSRDPAYLILVNPSNRQV